MGSAGTCRSQARSLCGGAVRINYASTRQRRRIAMAWRLPQGSASYAHVPPALGSRSVRRSIFSGVATQAVSTARHAPWRLRSPSSWSAAPNACPASAPAYAQVTGFSTTRGLSVPKYAGKPPGRSSYAGRGGRGKGSGYRQGARRAFSSALSQRGAAAVPPSRGCCGTRCGRGRHRTSRRNRAGPRRQ